MSVEVGQIYERGRLWWKRRVRIAAVWGRDHPTHACTVYARRIPDDGLVAEVMHEDDFKRWRLCAPGSEARDG